MEASGWEIGRSVPHVESGGPAGDSVGAPIARPLPPAEPVAARPHPGVGSDRIRRAINVLIAVLGLVVSLPVAIVVAVAIKLTSSGPVLYAQTRIGLDRRNGGPPNPVCRRRQDLGGRPFLIYKFRTMTRRKDRTDTQRWARPDDDRVTRIGRFLRKYRLDELPQLINVLKGEMNVVGPRPEQPRIFSSLRTRVPRYTERQAVLPGITGWAQVNHHYDQCLEDVRRKVELDLEYIRRRSVWEDLKIMVRTIPVMLLQRGAW